MSLFCVNGKPLMFDLINLGRAERAALTKMIESEGGRVRNDENVTVKFTSKEAFKNNNDSLERTQVHDIEFIKECVRQGKIVKPERYRLNGKIGEDDFHMQHLLDGKCRNSRSSLHACSSDDDVQIITYPAEPSCKVEPQETAETQTVHRGKTPKQEAFSFYHESMDDSQAFPRSFSELKMSGSPAIVVSDQFASDVEMCVERPIRLKEEPKEAVRTLLNVRESLQTNDEDSSDSVEEIPIPANIIEEVTIQSDPVEEVTEVMTVDVPETWPVRRRGNANDAGPSGLCNARESHAEKNGEPTKGKDLVRNVANPSFLEKWINRADPKKLIPKKKTSKNTSRGRAWRASLKAQTARQYTGVGSRVPFTVSERKAMVQYLKTHHSISRAKGLVVWTQMIADGHLTNRTPQSLQNQFQKHVLPNIEKLQDLDQSDLRRFLALRNSKR